MMELRTQLRRAAAYFANREALVHGDRRFTFAEAWSRGVRLANALADAGATYGGTGTKSTKPQCSAV